MQGMLNLSSRLLSGLFLALVLVACAAPPDDYVERPVEDIYNTAMNSLLAENFVGAAKEFDEVERQHPYSVWATKAQLMAAFANYQNSRYDEAIIALHRFIQLHPGNRDVAYAYYLKALCYYEQISDIARDPKMTELSLRALDEVVRRFPDSSYARDARLKLDLTTDHLAGKEMDIGRYYLRRTEYVAAINRFRRVVEKYQTTTHVPEALHRLTEAYLALGLVDDARQSGAVLGYNYPGSDWYADSYALLERGTPATETQSWLGRTWNWMF